MYRISYMHVDLIFNFYSMLKFVTVFLDFDVRLYFFTLKHLIMHSAFLCMFDDMHSCNYVYHTIIVKKKT